MVRMFSSDRAWVGRAVRAFRNPGRVFLWNHRYYHVINWQLLSFKGGTAEWMVCLEPVETANEKSKREIWRTRAEQW